MGDFLRSQKERADKKGRAGERWRRHSSWKGGSGRRMWVLWGVIGVLVVLLISRLAYMYGVENDKLRQEGEKRFLRQRVDMALRGSIEDRNGKPLAVSVPVSTIWVNLGILAESGDQAIKDIAKAVSVNEKKIRYRLAQKK